MNRKTMTGLGIGLCAAAAVGALAWPTKSRKRRMMMKALEKAADDLSGVLKIFYKGLAFSFRLCYYNQAFRKT